MSRRMSDLFPPFVPDANEPRRRLFKPVPFRVIAPNLIFEELEIQHVRDILQKPPVVPSPLKTLNIN